MSKKIAVYGTLRVGEYNYERFKSGIIKVIEEGKSVKGYKMYDLGPYPVIKRDFSLQEEVESIIVDILEVTEKCFNELHQMELGAGYQLDAVTHDIFICIRKFKSICFFCNWFYFPFILLPSAFFDIANGEMWFVIWIG